MSDGSEPSATNKTVQRVGTLVVMALLIAAIIAMKSSRSWGLIVGVFLGFIALVTDYVLRGRRARSFSPIATSRATISYVGADTAPVHYARLRVADTRGVELAIALGSVV